jgi:hypothetical protein
MTTITISDESTLGEKRAWQLDILEETMTLAELIRRRIYQEVTEYNARQVGQFYGLVQPTQAERLSGRSRDLVSRAMPAGRGNLQGVAHTQRSSPPARMAANLPQSRLRAPAFRHGDESRVVVRQRLTT